MPDRRTLALQLYLAMGNKSWRQIKPPRDTARVPEYRLGPTWTPVSVVDAWMRRGWVTEWRGPTTRAIELTEKGREAMTDRTQ